MAADPLRGLLDTNVLILSPAIDPDELPNEVAIGAAAVHRQPG